MNEKIEITQQPFYVFNRSDQSICIKIQIEKSVSPGFTYEKQQTKTSDTIKLIYRKIKSKDNLDKFRDSPEINLDIKVPLMTEPSKNDIKNIIDSHRNEQKSKPPVKIEIMFTDHDGSTEGKVITGISEDAEIDLTD